MATDPICGMQVDETTGRHAERDGEQFYFCSEHCRQTFLGQRSPGTSTGSACSAPSETSSRVIEKKSRFFCPMHPEIQQDHPGTCPKCGMALEARSRRRLVRSRRSTPARCTPRSSKTIRAIAPSAAWRWNRRSIVAGESDRGELDDMLRRFWVAAVLAAVVLLLAMLPMVGLPVDRLLGARASTWLQLVLSTPVVLWAGAPFFRRAWQSLLTRNLNMFTLIAIGTGTAYAYSLFATLVARPASRAIAARTARSRSISRRRR